MSVMNVLSHRPLDRFLNSLLRLTTQKYLFSITGPLWGEPRVAGIVFPSQRTSNAESGELLHLEQLGHLHKMSTVWLSPCGKHKELGLEIWKHWHKMTKEIQYQNCLITATELWLSCIQKVQGPVSISDKTSYCKISQSLEAARYYLELSDRSQIWQAHLQQCCRYACQISKRYDDLNYQYRSFETSRDLTIRRLIGYWNRAQVTSASASSGIVNGIMRAVGVGSIRVCWAV